MYGVDFLGGGIYFVYPQVVHETSRQQLVLIQVHLVLLAAMPRVGVLPRFARVIAGRRCALSAGSNGGDPLSPARPAGLPNRSG